jgi:hypothetical protein
MQPLARLAAVRSACPDRGDVLLSWLAKLTVVMAIAGVGLFEAVSVGVTATQVIDQGTFAAREASETWQATESMQKSYDAALAVAVEANPGNVIDTESFRIDDDNTVHLTISREATTLVLYRWGRTAEWAQIEREVTGRSVT